jgi:hypothetical protein
MKNDKIVEAYNAIAPDIDVKNRIHKRVMQTQKNNDYWFQNRLLDYITNMGGSITEIILWPQELTPVIDWINQ